LFLHDTITKSKENLIKLGVSLVEHPKELWH
jgi:hypothetical protein